MFTMCTLFSTLNTKAYGVCEGASKQSSELKNYTAPGPRPQVHKFLDPPLAMYFLKRDGTLVKGWRSVIFQTI